MCKICLCSPCHPQCPNAPDPIRIHTCSYCGEGILKGEEYMKLDYEYYHLECVEDNPVEILTSVFGARKATA